jgi:hypothetical protein
MSESKYLVWVDYNGVPWPQIWYDNYAGKTQVLSIKRLESKYENLSFNELVKLFPYEPPQSLDKKENENA